MALASVGLNTAIWNNNIRSIILLALYPLIIALLVWLIATASALTMLGPPSYGMDMSARLTQASHMGGALVWAYLPLIVTGVLLWFLISFFFHTKMIRMLSHARPVERQEEPELYNIVENLCISRGLDMPRLEIVESPALNAYASGIDKNSYAITVTRGIMQTLRPDELEGVIAHELTHIINRDVRLMIISIIFVGMIGFAAQLFWSTLRYRFAFRRRREERDDGRLLILVLIVGAVLWLGYVATLFTRFALSRRREFMADAGAVELTKNPDAMMRALLRISGRDRIAGVPEDIALMCIENSRPFLGMFSTHPPIEARVQALSALTGTPVPLIMPEAPAIAEKSGMAPDTPPRHRSPWRRNPWG